MRPLPPPCPPEPDDDADETLLEDELLDASIARTDDVLLVGAPMVDAPPAPVVAPSLSAVPGAQAREPALASHVSAAA
jgi:hypothetical protein